MGDSALAKGGNVKPAANTNPGSTKRLRADFITTSGTPARLIKRYLDAATELGVTHTGVLQYRRFPARILLLGYMFSGPAVHVDSVQAALTSVIEKYGYKIIVK